MDIYLDKRMARRTEELGRCRLLVGEAASVKDSGGSLILKDLETLFENTDFMKSFYNLFDHQNLRKLTLSDWTKKFRINLG